MKLLRLEKGFYEIKYQKLGLIRFVQYFPTNKNFMFSLFKSNNLKVIICNPRK